MKPGGRDRPVVPVAALAAAVTAAAAAYATWIMVSDNLGSPGAFCADDDEVSILLDPHHCPIHIVEVVRRFAFNFALLGVLVFPLAAAVCLLAPERRRPDVGKDAAKPRPRWRTLVPIAALAMAIPAVPASLLTWFDYLDGGRGGGLCARGDVFSIRLDPLGCPVDVMATVDLFAFPYMVYGVPVFAFAFLACWLVVGFRADGTARAAGRGGDATRGDAQ